MTLVLVLKTVWMFCAVGIIVLVLLHSPKGDGLSGLGGQAQLFTSTTWTLTVLFIGLTIVLSAGWLGR